MSVCAPQGFRASGVNAGISAKDKGDVALVVNDGPAFTAVGQFTTNRFAAAPVVVSRRHLANSQARAVVLNSGCANACTGEAGFATATASAQWVAKHIGCGADDVIVCSTGMIGERLPADALEAGVASAYASLSAEGADDAAWAILTTDTRPKQAVAHGEGYTVGGMAKGAGMLAPGLATMLVVCTTDALIDPADADAALAEACARTFNRIDSDGCMSTNDTVVLLASGASGVRPDPAQFTRTLEAVCAELARGLIGDAEGASHDIAITVTRAATEDQAVLAARTIARSNLFKAAVFGRDPNWGRIVSQLGTLSSAECAFDPDAVDVAINGITICRGGAAGDPREGVDLAEREVAVTVDLAAGDAEATVWTNDLTYDYVEENSAYSS